MHVHPITSQHYPDEVHATTGRELRAEAGEHGDTVWVRLGARPGKWVVPKVTLYLNGPGSKGRADAIAAAINMIMEQDFPE